MNLSSGNLKLLIGSIYLFLLFIGLNFLFSSIDIKDLTKGLGVDASLDASSSPVARSIAVKCVRTWGKACFVGEGGDVTLDVSNDLLRRQVTLIGSWTFSNHGQAECADFVADKKLDVDKLFTHRWSLDQAEEAYNLFDKQSDGKGVIIP